jgi:predicted DNA-binding transcriptional regulator AlpA
MPTKLGERHLDSGQVMERFCITKKTLYNWRADTDLGFPKPITIKKRHYFSLAAIEAWELEQGKLLGQEAERVQGCAVVSDIIRNYGDLVQAMRKRRAALSLTHMEVDRLAGLQEGYAGKLENWPKEYGRAAGAEILPLWLGGLRVGIILVDLPRRPYVKRKESGLPSAA